MVSISIPKGTETVYVSFSAEIDAKTKSLIAAMSLCANQAVQHVYLLLSTPGGAVMNGMNLYNVLRGMPFRLTTHNVGNVDSIGNAVFLAGEPRYATSNATFMFHGVGFQTQPNQRLEEQLLQERLDSLVNDHRRIAAVIAERTMMGEDEVADLFRRAQTKDATYAVEKGIVDEVRDVQIPEGSPIVALIFQR